MSAFLVTEDLINLIVNASGEPSQERFDNLLLTNLRSLATRYPAHVAEFEECAKDYNFEIVSPGELVERVYGTENDHGAAKYYPAVGKKVTIERVAAQIRKACDCFDYQASEFTGYEGTTAAKFVASVRNAYPANEQLESEALWGF